MPHALPPDDDADEDFVAHQLIDAIERQLEAGTPACTQAVYNKLTLVGYPREEVLRLMTYVLADEIQHLIAEERGFDEGRYESLLRQLPELPNPES